MSAEAPRTERLFLKFGFMKKLKSVRGLVVHHTGGEGGTVRSVHRLHRDVFGWSGIGYHYLIGNGVDTTDGRVYVGRPARYRGAHTRGANSRTVGIALFGNMEEHHPTPAQADALVKLLARLAFTEDLDPLGTTRIGLRSGPVISGHRDWGATDCPGSKLYSALPSVRELVSEELEKKDELMRAGAFGLGSHGLKVLADNEWEVDVGRSG
jgi:hypothetical protein